MNHRIYYIIMYAVHYIHYIIRCTVYTIYITRCKVYTIYITRCTMYCVQDIEWGPPHWGPPTGGYGFKEKNGNRINNFIIIIKLVLDFEIRENRDEVGGRVISRGGVGWRVVCGVVCGVETVGVGWSVFEIRDS